MKQIRAIDLFCGVGGSSWGAKSAGVEVVAGFDMWSAAESVYKDNFPKAKFYCEKLENTDPKKLAKKLNKIDLILASPECTNHSVAKGNKPRCERSKETVLLVLKFAKVFKPRWLVIENVVSMKKWKRYTELIVDIESLGYKTHMQVLNSADFGVPQARRRMFVLCDRRRQPQPVKIPKRPIRTARHIIDSNGTYNYSPLRTKRRATATLERADRAIASLGKSNPFLIVYYGTDRAGGWQSIDVPLRTITTLDRFAYVKSTTSGHVMRMLQPAELKRAMGWPKHFKINHGTRRDRIKMIGNAVCPPVMRSIVRSLIKDKS
ncbi:MAG: DNA cytosine methyltransferase [Desulfobacteraceae bacterium]|nr:DNA cytosine methyltransferase [Desulfobacteraceae bacterium]